MFQTRKGFALPTVLLSSVVMLMILAASVSVTASIHNAIREQEYTHLATLAAEAGTVMATACLNQTGGQATWTNTKPLRPNTDCNGNTVSGASPYVLEKDDVRTYFVVQQPIIGVGNQPVSSSVKGYSEVARSSSGIAWRVWSSDTSVALASGGDSTPVGTLIDGLWTTAPTGYLLADGTAVSRTTYANLFAVIGTTYGSGNGSTTFNLPDARGRVLVQKSTDTEFNTLGKKSGEKTHKLTLTEIPSHTHPLRVKNPGTGTFYEVGGGDYSQSSSTMAGGSSGPIMPAGGGAAHNNLQPSIAVNRAIKY